MAGIRARSWFSISAVAVCVFVRLPRRNLGNKFLDFCPSSPLSLITPSSTRRGRNGEVAPSATTIASPATAYPRISWRAVDGTEDPRVRRILSQCAFAAPAAPVPVAPQPAEGPVAAPPKPSYVVNGLSLGAPFSPQSDPATDYACHASDDFSGFSWCSSHHAESGGGRTPKRSGCRSSDRSPTPRSRSPKLSIRRNRDRS